MTYDLTPRAAEAIIALTGLTSQISRTDGHAEWLIADVLAYQSGAPRVKLLWQENGTAATRQQDLTFYADKDTLVLTVCQPAFNAQGGTDMDNPYDTPSDQPGFARRQR